MSGFTIDDWILDLWIIGTASLVAASCALVGVFLILRRQALMGDAISHSVLLGIVLAYLLSGSNSLSIMLLGAVIIGLITTWLSESLHKISRLQSDASIGIVFTLFFSLGVILVSLYTGQIDLDQECVLYGEIAFVPFDTLVWGDIQNGGTELGPRAFWLILIVFILVVGSIVFAFERLKTVTFHPSLAVSLGISISFWHYFLMTLVSMTTVASFDAVGAILVVALLIIPAASAYLFAKSLKNMLLLAVLYSQLAVWLGYAVAFQLDSSIAASIAVSAGLLLLVSLFALQLHKRRQKHFYTQQLKTEQAG
ncbi:manganese transport system membrane protein MntD [Thiosulfatimonas sediminis]|uniref:Manganese transport system membrane protein MntD n=1 Tax=Thiosulfatimonas sediminis TaxID=2675054 RepID=A0A6F8PWA9_9GAMM|nr:metal ABC transporter permease [Thiosulfatimonas sediminis]BBP46405.1 manganese transport system membrane protein MntD [Thiosulfatimonas sediminis]